MCILQKQKRGTVPFVSAFFVVVFVLFTMKGVRVMMFNATFNSIISWPSVLLVEELEHPICHKSLTNFIT